MHEKEVHEKGGRRGRCMRRGGGREVYEKVAGSKKAAPQRGGWAHQVGAGSVWEAAHYT